MTVPTREIAPSSDAGAPAASAVARVSRRLIALINSMGAVGGFVGPYLVGNVKERTGEFAPGLLLLAGVWWPPRSSSSGSAPRAPSGGQHERLDTRTAGGLDGRRQRILVSRTEVNGLKWTALVLQAICTLLAIAMVHSDNRLTAALALGLFSTAVAVCSADPGARSAVHRAGGGAA